MRSGLLIGLVSIGLATAKADEPPPSADFLAFLGEMERIDGEWVDPMSVETISLSNHGESAVEGGQEGAEGGSDNE
ncbi:MULTISPECIES: hypothetical protein [Marinobacter]|jgi:hypothetical protein|uniref:hypothetical protein n=1 Tax=Marinobacter TaxID=2742 RepID=UPI0011083E95|nr:MULTISPECIES: hypothetical protein [Marinobacter]MCK2149418.1 hypothetical protein [Marinobacter alexandrii]